MLRAIFDEGLGFVGAFVLFAVCAGLVLAAWNATGGWRARFWIEHRSGFLGTLRILGLRR